MTASRRRVLAEDGSGAPHVLSSTPGGPYLIARNQLNDSEFCGPTPGRHRPLGEVPALRSPGGQHEPGRPGVGPVPGTSGCQPGGADLGSLGGPGSAQPRSGGGSVADTAPVATAIIDQKPRPEAHRTVHVQLEDGRWVAGILQYGREVEGVWSWFVRCDAGSDVTRLEWFQEPRIWSVE